VLFADFIISLLVTWRWPDKRAEPFVLSLIFFSQPLIPVAYFASRQKSKERKKKRFFLDDSKINNNSFYIYFSLSCIKTKK
jgi:hypothetical protein